MMKSIKIAIVLFFIIPCFLYAKAQLSHMQLRISSKISDLGQYQNPLTLIPPTINTSFYDIPPLLFKQSNDAPTWSFAQHYQQQLGFFCKMEHKLEYKTKFPVKFRLGEVNYVDVLEGKRNAMFYQHLP